MFQDVAAFDQPLSFNTFKVTNVRVYLLFGVQPPQRGDPDSDFTYLDAWHVWKCTVLQSTSIF